MAPTVPNASAPRRYGSGMVIGGRRRGRGLLTDNINGVTKASIRKMARRGGVKSIKQDIYTMTKDVLEKKLREILARTILYTTHCNRKTVTTLDVIWALQRTPGLQNGECKPVYGYEWPSTQQPDKRVRVRSANAAATAWEKHITAMITTLEQRADERKATVAAERAVIALADRVVSGLVATGFGRGGDNVVNVDDEAVKSEIDDADDEYDVCDERLFSAAVGDLDSDDEELYKRTRIVKWVEHVAVATGAAGVKSGKANTLSFRVGKPGVGAGRK